MVCDNTSDNYDDNNTQTRLKSVYILNLYVIAWVSEFLL